MTFDGLDRWAKIWILSNSDMLVTRRRQQKGGSVIIWTGIVDQTIIEPMKELLNSPNYYNFMDKTFFAKYKSEPWSFKVKSIFMHSNTPSHVSKLTHEFFKHKRFTGEKKRE